MVVTVFGTCPIGQVRFSLWYELVKEYSWYTTAECSSQNTVRSVKNRESWRFCDSYFILLMKYRLKEYFRVQYLQISCGA
jgi:hypothetical protein